MSYEFKVVHVYPREGGEYNKVELSRHAGIADAMDAAWKASEDDGVGVIEIRSFRLVATLPFRGGGLPSRPPEPRERDVTNWSVSEFNPNRNTLTTAITPTHEQIMEAENPARKRYGRILDALIGRQPEFPRLYDSFKRVIRVGCVIEELSYKAYRHKVISISMPGMNVKVERIHDKKITVIEGCDEDNCIPRCRVVIDENGIPVGGLPVGDAEKPNNVWRDKHGRDITVGMVIWFGDPAKRIEVIGYRYDHLLEAFRVKAFYMWSKSNRKDYSVCDYLFRPDDEVEIEGA